MFLDLKTACCIGLSIASLAIADSQAQAQMVPHRAAAHPAGPCRSATCGSPLAGPCAPMRMTYNYVPVSWRRWPAHEADLPPAPEELPTPAKQPAAKPPAHELPEQPAPAETPRQSPLGTQPAPAMPSPTPFGSQPSTPNFGQEPQMTPFGDEPQTPPSAADPLAVPLGDEPPTPPADDEAPAMPPGETPAETAPQPEAAGVPAVPGDSNQPPEMPVDDPFKDDPESSSFGPSSFGPTTPDDRLEQAYLQRRQQLTPMASETRPASALQSDAASGPPRLLHADGGSLEARVLPEPAASVEGNPLRQVSHPVRKTASVQAAEPAGRQWRRNPLRSN